MSLGKDKSLMLKPCKTDLGEPRKGTDKLLALLLCQVSLEIWKLQRVEFHDRLPLNKRTELV